VCLIDPVGDVYACPFAIPVQFLAGNVRAPGGFTHVWRESELFQELRRPQSAGACASCGLFDRCRGGCMAAEFFTGLPLAGPNPERVLGHGQRLLKERGDAPAPRPSVDMSRRRLAVIGPRPCDERPVEVP
jgi:radical SAM protein with 4Fe4S-binding SPASM domain